MKRIWFHGTDRAASQKISEEGFKAHTYFAKHLEDAIEFGGTYVFEVWLRIPEFKEAWQIRIPFPLSAARIVRFTHYEFTVLADYPKRREKVRKANDEA